MRTWLLSWIRAIQIQNTNIGRSKGQIGRLAEPEYMAARSRGRQTSRSGDTAGTACVAGKLSGCISGVYLNLGSAAL